MHDGKIFFSIWGFNLEVVQEFTITGYIIDNDIVINSKDKEVIKYGNVVLNDCISSLDFSKLNTCVLHTKNKFDKNQVYCVTFYRDYVENS